MSVDYGARDKSVRLSLPQARWSEPQGQSRGATLASDGSEAVRANRVWWRYGEGREVVGVTSPPHHNPQPPWKKTMSEAPYRTWMCLICGWMYDEAAGLPEEGIAPGTRWEDIPMNWTCPECGARKEDFEMVEV